MTESHLWTPMTGHKKQQLRKELRHLLRTMVGSLKLAKEVQLAKNLSDVLKRLDPEGRAIIGGYAPLADEANWLGNLKLTANQKLSFPASCPSDQNDFSMSFFLCAYEELEVNSDFGVEIQVPPKGSQEVKPDILLIPGLGFSASGQRIGRGKGYYDRYLKEYKGHRVGICFTEQLSDGIPTEDYDQNIHILVTDKNIYHCQQN